MRASDTKDSLPLFFDKLKASLASVVALALFFTIFALGSEIFLLVFAGTLGAIFLNGIASWIEQHTGIRYSRSLAIAAISIAGIFTALILFMVPSISSQFTELSSRLPESIDGLRQKLAQSSIGRTMLEYLPQGKASFPASQLFSRAFGLTSVIAGFFGGLLILTFISLYLAANPKLYKNGVIRLVPVPRRPAASKLLQDLRTALGWWIIARLASMTLVGVLVMTGLLLMGVPLAPALGLIAAAFDFVPNFGPIAAALPASLLALSQGGQTVLYVLGLYAVVQVLEAYVFLPLVLKRAVDLPPVLTIIVQLFMGVIAGPFGLVLGDPMAVVLLVAVRNIYVEESLERAEAASAA